MSEMLELLDARRRRGTYAIMTESGTRYLVEVRKSPAGGMRVISDGSSVKMLREGTVGNCGCPDSEPIIQVGQWMHLGGCGIHIVRSSIVVSIEKIEDGAIDALVCPRPRCNRGYKAEGQPCRLCHH